jgi:hypothetical protein
LTIAGALDIGLGETERSRSTLLRRLVVSIGAADVKSVICAAANVSDRALLIPRNQSLTVSTALNVGLGEAKRSLGALLGRNPRAILTANLDSVVGTLLSLDGRAMVLVALVGRDTIALAFDGEISRASREFSTLLDRLPIGAVNATPKSVVVAAVMTGSTRVSHEGWTVVGKSERQGHYK